MTDSSVLQAVFEEAQRHFKNTCAGVSRLRPVWPQDPLCLHERWDMPFKLDDLVYVPVDVVKHVFCNSWMFLVTCVLQDSLPVPV